MPDYDENEDFSNYKPKKEKVVEIKTSNNATASGYCEKCHERFNDVPLINNIPQCPNCS